MPPPRQRFLVLAAKGKRNDNPDRTGTVLEPSGATVHLLVDLSNPDRRMTALPYREASGDRDDDHDYRRLTADVTEDACAP